MFTDSEIQEFKNALDGFNSKSYPNIVSGNPLLRGMLEKFNAIHPTKKASEAIYCIYHDIEPQKCPCGNRAAFNAFTLGYRKFCSTSCPEKAKANGVMFKELFKDPEYKDKVRRRTMEALVERFGTYNVMEVPKIREKQIATNMARYGCEHPLQSAAIRDKAKQTCLQNHGVESPFQSKGILEKAQKTTIEKYGGLMIQAREKSYEKYGGKNPFQDEEIKEKSRQTRLKKYGVEYYSQTDEYNEKVQSTSIERYGRRYYAQLSYDAKLVDFLESGEENIINGIKGKTTAQLCVDYGFPSTDAVLKILRRMSLEEHINFSPRSAMETCIAEWLIEWGIEFKQNDRLIIAPKELDFIIPSHKVAIECHGLFFHSEISRGLEKDYHYYKYSKGREAGYEVIQIHQDEFWVNNEAVKYMLMTKLGLHKVSIGARQCQIEYFNDPTFELTFYKNNTIGHSDPSRTHCLVAKFDGEVIGMLQYSINGDICNILQYGTRPECRVVGLFSKFLTYIKRTNDLSVIYGISDNRLCRGKLFERCGFVRYGEKQPDFQLTDYRVTYTKEYFLNEVVAENTDVDLDNIDHVNELGFDRIWDAGKTIWQLNC